MSDAFQALKAGGADALAFKFDYVVYVGAKGAAGNVFFQDDAAILGKDLQGILGLNVEGLSYLRGEDDSSELVYLACHSG